MIALPCHYENFDKIVMTFMQSFHQADATHSVDKMTATGQCFDNIKAKELPLPFLLVMVPLPLAVYQQPQS
jgi:hypothetical protein